MFLSMLDGVSPNSYSNYQFFPPHVCLFLHSEMKYSYGEGRYGKAVLSVLLSGVSTILLITFFQTQAERSVLTGPK